MSRNRVLVAIVALGIAIVSFSACSADPQENEMATCEAYAIFADSVEQARETFAGSPTVGEISEARENVKSSYDSLASSLDTVAEDRQRALESAVESFVEAVQDLDPDLSVTEAVNSLLDELAAIDAARLGVNEELSC